MRCGPTRASASCSRMTAMTAPFRYRRLSYVVLDVADIDRSLAFYRDLVGLAVDRRQGDVVYLRCSELPQNRSEERRVGKECVSTCRSRWSPDHYKNKTKKQP